jgi:uncharacterized delta-60 repeat protein
LKRESRSWRWRVVAAVVTALMLAGEVASAEPGDRDGSFGTNGVAVHDVGPYEDQASRVAIQPDGKLVVAGSVGTDEPSPDGGRGTDFLVERFTVNGQLDTSFGAGGTIVTDHGPDDVLTGLVIQPDGKIVVAGAGPAFESGARHLLLYRYLSSGVPDPTFGSAGVSQTYIEHFGASVALALGPNGTIYMAGTNYGLPVVARFLPNGQLDSSYNGGNGTSIHSNPGIAGSIVVTADGSAYVGLEIVGDGITISPFNAAGVGQRSFWPAGADGPQIKPTAIAIQPDGAFVGVARDNDDYVVFRWTAEGARDATFGNGLGMVRTSVAPPSGGADLPSDITVLPDGKIVAVGTAGEWPAAVRYLPDGRLDPTFGAAGISIGTGVDASPNAVALVGNKLVMAGTNATTEDRVVVVRMDNASWQWAPLGGYTDDAPEVVAWGPGRLDVFVRGGDNQLWHRWKDAGGWHPWEPLGGILRSGPAAASWASGRLDVFVRGVDDQLWHRSFSNGWRGWEPLGGVLNASPNVTSWGANRLDIFVRGGDNALWHKWWDGARWGGDEFLGGGLAAAPASSSNGVGSLEVLALGNDKQLWRRWWNGQRWVDWAFVGTGPWDTAPEAVPRNGATQVFTVRNGLMFRGMVSNGAPSGFRPIGVDATSAPSAAVSTTDLQDVMTRGPGGDVQHARVPASPPPAP